MTLRFFRKYNKFILAGGGTLLMVAFLIQPFMNQFGPNRANAAIGFIDGQKITGRDMVAARNELDHLQTLMPELGLGQIDPMQWLMMQYEARQIGLDASRSEVENLLVQMKLDEDGLERHAHRQGVSVGYMRQVLASFVRFMHYRQVIEGLSGDGRLRVSRPVVERFVHDWLSTVWITAVQVPSTNYLDRVEPPDEQTLSNLFERYKDSLPGEGGPYGFGYRHPDRVRLEYLEIPGDALRDSVTVGEDEGMQYYQENKKDFVIDRPAAVGAAEAEGPDKSTPVQYKDYLEVRKLIIGRLINDKARALGERMIKSAMQLVKDHNRGLTNKDGYLVLDDEAAEKWQALALTALGEQLNKQFGVNPAYYRFDQQNLDRDDSAVLPGIGATRLLESPLPAGFADVVFSARQLLGADTDSPLAKLHVQHGVVAVEAPLVSVNDSFYLFRILAVNAEHSPASIDEVKLRVEADARRLAAYQLLLAEQDAWRDRARSENLEPIAEQLGTEVLSPPSFPRRQVGFRGESSVPEIVGVGRVVDVVDRAFEIASHFPDMSDLEAAALEQRIDAVAVDESQSLLLLRLEKLTPMRRSTFENVVNKPMSDWNNPLVWLSVSMRGSNQSALSVDVLKQRLNWEEAGEPTTDQDAETSPAAQSAAAVGADQ